MESNLANQNNPTLNGLVHTFGLSGYPTVTFQIEGTFSAGNYTPQVSNDATVWGNIPAVKSDGTSSATVNAAGLYRCDVNGYQLWRLNPSSDIAAVCSVISIASPLAL